MRLIDADALMETLEKLQRNADKCIPVERGIWMGFNYALTEIKGSPTVDAVQVVRCRDCEHWMARDGQFGGYAKCALEGAWHGEEFYCANGVKRA